MDNYFNNQRKALQASNLYQFQYLPIQIFHFITNDKNSKEEAKSVLSFNYPSLKSDLDHEGQLY